LLNTKIRNLYIQYEEKEYIIHDIILSRSKFLTGHFSFSGDDRLDITDAVDTALSTVINVEKENILDSILVILYSLYYGSPDIVYNNITLQCIELLADLFIIDYECIKIISISTSLWKKFYGLDEKKSVVYRTKQELINTLINMMNNLYLLLEDSKTDFDNSDNNLYNRNLSIGIAEISFKIKDIVNLRQISRFSTEQDSHFATLIDEFAYRISNIANTNTILWLSVVSNILNNIY